MDCIIVGVTVENNKYQMESMTLRFAGHPTVRQAVATAKQYQLGCSFKPDYDHPNFEVHMRADGENTLVQFYPNVRAGVKTTTRR